jgi:hypothetical protein
MIGTVMNGDQDPGSDREDRRQPSRRDGGPGPVMKLFVLLLGLAGLGLGVWLFGRRRKGERPDE